MMKILIDILQKEMRASEFTTLDGQDPLTNAGGNIIS